MAEELEVKQLDDVVVRFSGDSGDGMQLAGNIFSTVSATIGNGISTFRIIRQTSAPRKDRLRVFRAFRFTSPVDVLTLPATSVTCWWP